MLCVDESSFSFNRAVNKIDGKFSSKVGSRILSDRQLREFNAAMKSKRGMNSDRMVILAIEDVDGPVMKEDSRSATSPE